MRTSIFSCRTRPLPALRRQQPNRSGTIVVLSAFMLVLVFALLAFSVDMGMAYMNQAELQRSADAAAISAATELLDQQILNPTSNQSSTSARTTAQQFAAYNAIGNHAPQLATSDVTIGYMPNLNQGEMQNGQGTYNAVKVRVQRTEGMNGRTPFYFAKVLGFDGVEQSAEGTAAYVAGFRGFKLGSNGQNLGILPIALDVDTWGQLMAEQTNDEWTWDAEEGTIEFGSDGLHEVNLYPQGTGLPGNRGTIDIGSSGNSTNDIKRQILDGVSADDLSHHGGKLELDSNGHLTLNGDTGISAAIKDQLDQIKGEPRIIPLFDYAAGNGNNANFQITGFVGVRVMEVKLTGKMNSKRVIIQPAAMRTLGGIPSTSQSYTEHIYSPVKLIH